MHNYSTRLFDTPFYRDTAGGALDPTIQYSVNKAREYHTKAPQIRDMRFAKSSAFDADFAIRNQKERDISTLYASGADPLDMQGAHARMKLTGTQTGGALASYLKGGPQVNFTDMDGHVRSSNLGFDNHPVSQRTQRMRSAETASGIASRAKQVADRASARARGFADTVAYDAEQARDGASFFDAFGSYDYAPTREGPVAKPAETTSGKAKKGTDPTTPSTVAGMVRKYEGLLPSSVKTPAPAPAPSPWPSMFSSPFETKKKTKSKTKSKSKSKKSKKVIAPAPAPAPRTHTFNKISTTNVSPGTKGERLRNENEENLADAVRMGAIEPPS